MLFVAAAIGATIYLGVNHYLSSALLRNFEPSSPADEPRLLQANHHCPRNPRPFFLLFGLYANMTQQAEEEVARKYYEQAVRWGRMAVELNPTSSLYHERLAKLMFWGNPRPTERDLELAEQHFQQAVELDPAFPEWALSLANFYLETGRFSKADEYYRRVIVLGPNRMQEVVAKLIGAGTSIERMRAILPQTLEVKMALGDYLLKHGNREQAAASYADACELAANAPARERIRAAEGLAGAGEVEKARNLLDTWLKQSWEKLPYIRALAKVARIANDTESRLSYLKMAVEKAPSSTRDLADLADAWVSQGESEEALVYYRKSWRLEPRSERFCKGVVGCLKRLGREDEALEAAREFLHREPRSASAHFLVGKLLYEQGRVVEAVDYYERACALSPSNRHYQDTLKKGARELERLRRLRSERGK